MTNTIPAVPAFRIGEEVVLAIGTYQGTQGAFLRLREDPAWADITERDGGIRSHPLAWLARAAGANPGDSNGAADRSRQPR